MMNTGILILLMASGILTASLDSSSGPDDEERDQDLDDILGEELTDMQEYLQEPTENLLEVTAPRSEVTNLAVALPGVHDYGDRGDFSWLAPYCHHTRLSGALTTGLITCEEQVVSEGT